MIEVLLFDCFIVQKYLQKLFLWTHCSQRVHLIASSSPLALPLHFLHFDSFSDLMSSLKPDGDSVNFPKLLTYSAFEKMKSRKSSVELIEKVCSNAKVILHRELNFCHIQNSNFLNDRLRTTNRQHRIMFISTFL